MSENDLRYMLWKSQKLYTNEIPTLNEMQKLLYYDIKTSKNEKLRDLLFREGIDSPRYIETEDEQTGILYVPNFLNEFMIGRDIFPSCFL